MGLFGGGNSSSTSNTTTQDYQATLSPGSSVSGAGVSLVISPQSVGGGTFGDFSPTVYDAPLNITTSDNQGDAAIAAAQATAQAQIAAQAQTAAGASPGLPTWLTGLFTGDNLYWLLGALLLLMFARGHHRI